MQTVGLQCRESERERERGVGGKRGVIGKTGTEGNDRKGMIQEW